MFTFAIPSYGRADNQKTLQYLSSLGYTRSEIVISTQTESDFEEYKARHSEVATVIYRGGSCVSDNRNTLLRHFPSGYHIVMLDDDITALEILLGGKSGKLLAVDSRAELDKLIESAFDYCAKSNARLWGIYPVRNPFFMKRTIDKRNLLIGTVLGIVNSFEFRREYTVKEDYEACCRDMAQGRNVCRFNFLTANAQHRAKNGGVNWDGDVSAIASARLIKEYPTLVAKHPTRKGEVKYIGKN